MDYNELFNNELDMLLEENKDKAHKAKLRESMRTSIEEDIDKLTDVYTKITADIKERFPEIEARVIERDENGEEIGTENYSTSKTRVVIYKGEDKVTYRLLKDSKVDKEEDTNEFKIEVGGSLRLPDLLVKVYKDYSYCYFEESDPFTDDKQELYIEENKPEPENEEDTQFNKVLEKHIKKMAQSIAKDNFIE